jgi:hypothetical protein
MATQADYLRGINEALKSAERREQFKLTTAMNMMQIAQAQRAQDIQIASSSLELLQSSNQQMTYEAASAFIQGSGLGSLYSHFESKYGKKGTAMEEAVEELQKKSGKGELGLGVGMSPSESNRIVSAVWSAVGEANDPTGILSIAEELKGVQDYGILPEGIAPSSSSIRMHKALGSLGYFDNQERANRELASISKVIENKKNIRLEIFELAKGDTEINRDIGVLESIPKPEPDVDMASMLKKFEESRKKDKSVQEISSNLKDLKEKRRLSMQGWDVDESEEDLEKEIKDAAQLLREKHLEEVSQFGEPADKEVFGALDELGIPHSEENVDMMTRRIQTEQQVMF